MKQKLTDTEKENLLPHILAVIATGKPWENKELHYPAGAIIAAVLSIKGMKKNEDDEDLAEGFDTNGWQWDWWQNFKHGGKNYTLSGSGYYGGHGFHVSDE